MTKAEVPSSETQHASLVEQVRALASSQVTRTMFEVGYEAQAEASDFVRNEIAVEHGLCTAMVGSTAWFAEALHLNRSDQRFFPADWIEPTCKVNPDFTLACVLCQLANYGHSVIELVSRGLDTPARALLRSTADLSYMLAVLSVDRETFQTFVLENTLPPKEHWYKLFSSRKIAQRIARADQTLGLPTQWTAYMREFRDVNGEFFSEAVHHSRDSIFVGSNPTIAGTDRVAFALLGGPPSGSKATLTHLATVLNYGLTTFINSKLSRPEFTPQFSQPDYWNSGFFIYEAIQPLFLRMLNQREEKC